MDLSILIPARNEMFLKNTIDDILANIEADTEIIVVLDGAWPVEPIPDHERLTMVYLGESIGQRAATNTACRISQAKYVMKCDAHCSFGKGFDRILIEDMQGHDDWTISPKMYNLHAFDWVCSCGHRLYQGPTPSQCPNCGEKMEREIIWKAKRSPETTAMRFDNNLRFQYWSDFKKRQFGDLVETMSILGACWMLRRDRYLDLNICDEEYGSWGQQGTEVACKTWLSGGRLIVDKRTWFAHMFRTQGGDFGFPYPLSGKIVDKAREYSKKQWIDGTWEKAKHPLSWLVDKFSPVPGWPHSNNKNLSKGIVYYTDNRCNVDILKSVQDQLKRCCNGHQIVSVSLQPIEFGENLTLDLDRGYLTMFKQILAGLEASNADIIFLCEHDVLYHACHFEFIPQKNDVYYYNENTWKVDIKTGQALFYHTKQTSGLCAYRELLIQHYRKRIERVEKDGFSRRMGFEPGTHSYPRGIDNYKAESWFSAFPNIDIRHDKNLTANRFRKDQFRSERSIRGWTEADEIPGWGKTKNRFWKFLEEINIKN